MSFEGSQRLLIAGVWRKNTWEGGEFQWVKRPSCNKISRVVRRDLEQRIWREGCDIDLVVDRIWRGMPPAGSLVCREPCESSCWVGQRFVKYHPYSTTRAARQTIVCVLDALLTDIPPAVPPAAAAAIPQ